MFTVMYTIHQLIFGFLCGDPESKDLYPVRRFHLIDERQTRERALNQEFNHPKSPAVAKHII